jgi:transposase
MVRCSLLRLAGRRSALRQSAPARDFVVGISKVSERMRKERKHYSAEEKAAILRRHLLDEVPVSDLCEETGLRPTLFYRWQKEFCENGAAADNLGLRISPR